VDLPALTPKDSQETRKEATKEVANEEKKQTVLVKDTTLEVSAPPTTPKETAESKLNGKVAAIGIIGLAALGTAAYFFLKRQQ